MEKILLFSSKRETEELVRGIVGQKANLLIFDETQQADANNDPLLILIDCDYLCNLDQCLSRFLFVRDHRPTPAAILKPVIIKNSPFLPGISLRILIDPDSNSIQKDVFTALKRTGVYLGSSKFQLLPNKPLKKIIEAQRLLAESSAESRKLEDLARRAGWSPAWLSTNFKKISGISLSRYRAREAGCRALWQLVSTDKPVKTIALEAGYEPLYFSRLFHKMFGMPPSFLRQMLFPSP